MKKKACFAPLGAFIGTLIGIWIWSLLTWNAMKGVLGFVMIAFTLVTYYLCKLKWELKGLLLCVMLSVFGMVVGEYLSLARQIYVTFKNEGMSLLTAFLRVPEFLSFQDVFNDTMRNMMVGMLCILLVGAVLFVYIKRKSTISE